MFMMPEVIIHGYLSEDEITSQYSNQYWVAEGVCALLKIGDAEKAITKLNPDEKWTILFKDKDNEDSDEVRSRVLVNFSGLCSLLLCSESPVADKFRRWLTQAVIPEVFAKECIMPLEKSLKDDLKKLGLLPC